MLRYPGKEGLQLTRGSVCDRLSQNAGCARVDHVAARLTAGAFTLKDAEAFIGRTAPTCRNAVLAAHVSGSAPRLLRQLAA